MYTLYHDMDVIVEYFVMFSDQNLSVHGCCCHYRRRFHFVLNHWTNLNPT